MSEPQQPDPRSRVRHVVAVVLSFNSARDVAVCGEQLLSQVGIRLTLVVVDNASAPECRGDLRRMVHSWDSRAITGTEAEVLAQLHSCGDSQAHCSKVLLVENPENRGYSAGNNVGLRLCLALGADAALIANPDMRFPAPTYVSQLSAAMSADQTRYVVASRIVLPGGGDQNPLREPTFLEELLWFRWLLPKFVAKPSYLVPQKSTAPVDVPKVSGCCFLLSARYLQEHGLLDENVFLYCEEPILAARVQRAGGRISYLPNVTAVHAHADGSRAADLKRMKIFVRSRMYYLRTYTQYDRLQIASLSLTYKMLLVALSIRAKVAKCA